MTKKTKKPAILFYDIETLPLQAWVWRTGKQVVSHNQLVDGADRYVIICIGYEWLHTGKGGVLVFDYDTQDCKDIVQQFTELCDQADLVIGKNNRRFDDKHMNAQRMFHNLPGRPDLLENVDDLETQMRRHFYLPSHSLDYISKQLGLGGKDRMNFCDWIDIATRNKNGKKALRKMVKYCRKDVADTVKVWKYCQKHVQPKYNYSKNTGELVCKQCGSADIHKRGFWISAAGVRYQKYMCNSCHSYAGKVSTRAKNKTLT